MKQPDERLRSVFQAVHDGFPVLHLAFLEPFGNLPPGLGKSGRELEDQEPFDARPLDDQMPEEARATRGSSGIVLVDLAERCSYPLG